VEAGRAGHRGKRKKRIFVPPKDYYAPRARGSSSKGKGVPWEPNGFYISEKKGKRSMTKSSVNFLGEEGPGEGASR